MAMIDTASAGSMWVEDNRDLVRCLRLALVEELAAVNTYEKLACGIRHSGYAGVDPEGRALPVPEGRLSVAEAKDIADSILEIAHDELTHCGKLAAFIELLSPESAAAMREGATEA